jgi:hypothetical protein
MDDGKLGRFLVDYKTTFLGRSVEIGLRGDTTWTGTLDRADESGVWLTEAVLHGSRTTFIPWDAIESTTMPPFPEAEE